MARDVGTDRDARRLAALGAPVVQTIRCDRADIAIGRIAQEVGRDLHTKRLRTLKQQHDTRGWIPFA